MHLDLSRDTTGMVLHKDSKWYQQWQEFKDNNPVVNGKYCLVPGNVQCTDSFYIK